VALLRADCQEDITDRLTDSWQHASKHSSFQAFPEITAASQDMFLCLPYSYLFLKNNFVLFF